MLLAGKGRGLESGNISDAVVKESIYACCVICSRLSSFMKSFWEIIFRSSSNCRTLCIRDTKTLKCLKVTKDKFNRPGGDYEKLGVHVFGEETLSFLAVRAQERGCGTVSRP